MKERSLIREFLETMKDNSNHHGDIRHDEDYSLDSMRPKNSSHHSIDPNKDGIVKQEDLHAHFDQDGDGVVTTDDYRDHIEFHCKHPETLDHYNTLREKTYKTVPCKSSYDSCSRYLMSNTDDIDKYLAPLMGSVEEADDCLMPLMKSTGSTCRTSSVQAVLDVVQSLINCGLF